MTRWLLVAVNVAASFASNCSHVVEGVEHACVWSFERDGPLFFSHIPHTAGSAFSRRLSVVAGAGQVAGGRAGSAGAATRLRDRVRVRWR